MDNNYYVYEWIRLDTNEPFYVGKGKGNRWRRLNRNNKHFNNIVKSIPVAVNILHDNLDEQTAYGLEVWYIREYRDIIGYESMCNINDGGEGCALCGEKNGMYGEHLSDETKKKMSESRKGENNPMYGKDWRDYMTEEAKREHDRKMREVKYKSVVAVINNKIFGAFDYIRQGAEYFNIKNNSNISACCKGKIKSCGKYNGYKIVWRYIEIIEL